MNWYKRVLAQHKTYTGEDFYRILRPYGIYVYKGPEVRQSGSGETLINPHNGKQATFHDRAHKGKDMNVGIMNSILNQLGLDSLSFWRAQASGKKKRRQHVKEVTKFVPDRFKEEKEEKKKKEQYINTKWWREQQKYKEPKQHPGDGAERIASRKKWYKKLKIFQEG